jgi:hypothetical protein
MDADRFARVARLLATASAGWSAAPWALLRAGMRELCNGVLR